MLIRFAHVDHWYYDKMPERHAEISQLAASLPHEDQTTLDMLKDASMVPQWALSRVDYHRKEMVELIAGIEKSIATLHSIYNTTLPIHRLPVEILMHIFADRRLLDPKLRLMQVCRYWREVVIATPRFWANAITDLSPPRDPSQLDAWVTRSGSIPLPLTIIRDHLQRWRMHLPKIANRVTVLVIQEVYKDDGPILQEALRSKWSRLVRFSCGLKYTSANLRIVCTKRNFPRLRNLAIHGFSLPSTSISPSLTTFRVSGRIEKISALAAALKGCPMLKFLNLRDFLPEEWRDHTAPAIASVLPMIELPRLKQLDIGTPKQVPMRDSGPEDVLNRFILPHSAQIFFQAAETVTLPLDTPAFHSVPSIDRMFLGLEWQQYEDDKYWEREDLRRLVAYCYAEDWLKLRFEVGEQRDEEHKLADIMRPFGTLPITTLSIYPLEEEYIPEAWMPVLIDAFPKLNRLELLCGLEPETKLQAVEVFLQAHDERNDLGNTTLVWTVPVKGDRRANPTEDLKGLAKLLDTRWMKGKASLQRLELRHPGYRLNTLPGDPVLGEDYKLQPAEYDKSIIDELRELVFELVVLVESEASGPPPSIGEAHMA